MKEQTYEPLSVSRRLRSRATVTFDAQCDPVNHPAFDGSGLVRSGSDAKVVTRVSDVFTMTMHNDEDGADATIITESYEGSNATDELRRVLRNGERRRESTATSLVLLDQTCASDAR